MEIIQKMSEFHETIPYRTIASTTYRLLLLLQPNFIIKTYFIFVIN